MTTNTTKQPKKFSDFNIKPESTSFIGPSIEIQDILNQEILVLDYKIGPSKHPKKPGDQCLHLQIKYDGQLRVIFSGSIYLQQMIQKVPKVPDVPEEESGFPFETVIIREKDSKRLLFKH